MQKSSLYCRCRSKSLYLRNPCLLHPSSPKAAAFAARPGKKTPCRAVSLIVVGQSYGTRTTGFGMCLVFWLLRLRPVRPWSCHHSHALYDAGHACSEGYSCLLFHGNRAHRGHGLCVSQALPLENSPADDCRRPSRQRGRPLHPEIRAGNGAGNCCGHDAHILHCRHAASAKQGQNGEQPQKCPDSRFLERHDWDKHYHRRRDRSSSCAIL